MINPIILDILKRKIEAEEIAITDIKIQEYKDALVAHLSNITSHEDRQLSSFNLP